MNEVATQRFNRRHGTVGHLLQGRYKAILVNWVAHPLELCLYVVLNPVPADLVGTARDWRWSSYRATAGQAAQPHFLTTDWILAQFSSRHVRSKAAYLQFVSDGRGAPSPWTNLRGQVLLRGEAFLERMRPHLAKAALSHEIPNIQRNAARPTLEQPFTERATRPAPDRDARILAAVLEHGYAQCHVARHLYLREAIVSRIVTRMRRASGSPSHARNKT